ncbi:MAG: 50S ribosomal protein L30e [Methanobacteriota archaeon]
MDILSALKSAVTTGKVMYGADQARKALKGGKAKMLVVAANCPDREIMAEKGVRILKFEGSGIDLGAACGKPFNVSVLTILDPGESAIMSA